MIAIALNDGADTALGGVSIFPRVFTFSNVMAVASDEFILRSFFVSVSRVVIATTFAFTIQFLAAYAFTSKDLPGRTWMLLFLTLPMFFTAGLVPLYIVVSKLHLTNNFLVYVLLGSFSLFNMIIIRTYIYSLPASLSESARVDGASEMAVLFRIILPLSKPIIATICLWLAVGYWNDWTTTLYFVNDRRLFTMQYNLMQVVKESDRITQLIQAAQERGENFDIGHMLTPESVKAAQLLVTTIPIICVYPFVQKYFIKGVMIGSVKG